MTKKPKIVYYTTAYGYGHVVRGNSIAKAIADRADIHMISGIDIIFELSKNIVYHQIDELKGWAKIDREIYYYQDGKRSNDTPSGEYIKQYRMHFKKFVDLVCKIDPDLVVIDVTPEFAIYSRLLGYKTVEMLLTGKKDDLRTEISYSSVDHIVVPYPKGFIDVSYWPEKVRNKMFYSGAFSRFDGLKITSKEQAKAKISAKQGKKLIVCAFGRGDLDNEVVKKINELAKEQEFSNCEFKLLQDVKNVEDYLNAADCVISGAGDNTVAENAYFKVPMILIPLVRSYGEQTSKAEALEKMGAAKMVLENEIQSKLKPELLKLLDDQEYIEKSREAQLKFVDGKGAERIADKIIEWSK